jgi:hypothetical protein
MLHKAPRLRCVFLNGCCTAELAHTIVSRLPHLLVICWASLAEDTAARAFAQGFHDAVGVSTEMGEELDATAIEHAYWAGLERMQSEGFALGDPALYLHAPSHPHNATPDFHGCEGCCPPVHGLVVLLKWAEGGAKILSAASESRPASSSPATARGSTPDQPRTPQQRGASGCIDGESLLGATPGGSRWSPVVLRESGGLQLVGGSARPDSGSLRRSRFASMLRGSHLARRLSPSRPARESCSPPCKHRSPEPVVFFREKASPAPCMSPFAHIFGSARAQRATPSPGGGVAMPSTSPDGAAASMTRDLIPPHPRHLTRPADIERGHTPPAPSRRTL